MQSYLHLYLQANVKNIALIANFFKKSKPANVLNTIVLLFLFFLADFVFQSTDVFLMNVILRKIGLFLLLVFYMLVVNFIIGKNALTGDNTFGLVFVALLFGAFPETMRATPFVLANIALLFALRKIYSLRSVTSTQNKLFDAGFWIGVAAIYQCWSLAFIVLVPTALVAYKKVQIRYILISFVGAIIPLVLFFTYHIWFNSLEAFLQHFSFDYVLDQSAYADLRLQVPLWYYGSLILLILLIITPPVLRVNNKFKSTWQLYVIHLLVALIVAFLLPAENGSELLFVIFPLAIGIANLIERPKSSIPGNVVIFLSLILVVLSYYL